MTAISIDLIPLPAATSSGTTVAVDSGPIQNSNTESSDSYAAGFGTGVIEDDGCRRGEYSYPNQLAALVEGTIDFQRALGQQAYKLATTDVW